MNAISFMSEHTAEYALVPHLVAQIQRDSFRITPVFFWATREGSRAGQKESGNSIIKIVAAYARRPKLLTTGDKAITVKINAGLFNAASAGAEFGIPVFAGVPLVRKLTEYTLDSPCSWFKISGTQGTNQDAEFMTPLSQQGHSPTLPEGVSGPLARGTLADIVDTNCWELDWTKALEAMRHIKRAGGMQQPIFGVGHRPFFLLISMNV